MKTYIVKIKDAALISEDKARRLLFDYAYAVQNYNRLADDVAERLGNPFFKIQGGEEVAYFANDDDFKSDAEIEKWVDDLIDKAKDEGYIFKE